MTLEELLRNGGIVAVGFEPGRLSQRDAWSPIIRVSAEPTMRASNEAECRTGWKRICASHPFLQEPDLLVSIGGVSSPGWARVRAAPVEELPFRLAPIAGEPEIVVMNEQQSELAACTTEEHSLYLYVARRRGDGTWHILSADDFPE